MKESRETDLSLLEPDKLELTAQGKGLIPKIEKINGEIITKINDVIEGIKDLSKKDLLYICYSLYPDFTTNSKIKERVDSNVFEKIEIDLNDLKDTDTLRIKTDKGNQITAKISNNKIIIEDFYGS